MTWATPLYRAENDYRYGMPHSRTYCIILYPTPSTPHTASRSPDNPGAGPRGDESREVCSCLRDRPSVNASWRPGSWDAKGASWGYGVLRIPARVLGYGVPRTPPAPPKKPYPGDMPRCPQDALCVPGRQLRVFRRPVGSGLLPLLAVAQLSAVYTRCTRGRAPQALTVLGGIVSKRNTRDDRCSLSSPRSSLA